MGYKLYYNPKGDIIWPGGYNPKVTVYAIVCTLNATKRKRNFVTVVLGGGHLSAHIFTELFTYSYTERKEICAQSDAEKLGAIMRKIL